MIYLMDPLSHTESSPGRHLDSLARDLKAQDLSTEEGRQEHLSLICEYVPIALDPSDPEVSEAFWKIRNEWVPRIFIPRIRNSRHDYGSMLAITVLWALSTAHEEGSTTMKRAFLLALPTLVLRLESLIVRSLSSFFSQAAMTEMTFAYSKGGYGAVHTFMACVGAGLIRVLEPIYSNELSKAGLQGAGDAFKGILMSRILQYAAMYADDDFMVDSMMNYPFGMSRAYLGTPTDNEEARPPFYVMPMP